MENKHLHSHDEFATTYDAQMKKYNSYGHDILFGMCFEYVRAGETLLDLGIGTGLSSINFAQVGLLITGLDGSAEMLKECRKKKFAHDLRLYDIRNIPLPFADNTFSFVICCGVLHFFGDLWPISKEAHRLLKSAGIFAITVASLSEKDAGVDSQNPPDFIETQSAWGITIYKHSDTYIQALTQRLGFQIQKEQKVLAESGDKDAGDILFKVVVMQK
jgi:predicted TPR repeat methyltransferase